MAWQEGVRIIEDVVQVGVPGPLERRCYQCCRLSARYHLVPGGQGTDGLLPSSSKAAPLSWPQPDRGIGSPEFQRVLAENPDLDGFIGERILDKDYFVMDQWQLEKLAQVVQRCRVKVVSHGLAPEMLRRCHVEPAATVEQA